jgi:succinoglycan biosynthesis transport protein ExoP
MTPGPNSVSVVRRAPDVEDYIDMLRRYRAWIIGPMFVGLVIATVVAFFWPDTYVSTAVMRVTPQQVPENLVPSAISSQMAERLQQMETEILSRTSLAEIIQKPSLNLYERDRQRIPMEDLVQKMRNKDVRISSMTNAGGGRNSLASAFTIQFSYPDRYKAQAVVRELVTKFTEQNVRFQQNQATITNDFLSSELKSAKERMDELSSRLTRFRIENAGTLPEEAQANASALQTYRLQIMALGQNINSMQSDKTMLESNLQNLRARLTFANANLEQNVAGSAQISVRNERLINLEKDLADANAKLAASKELFGANHPDVIAQQAIIDALQRQRMALERQDALRPATGGTAPSRIINPDVQRSIEEIKGEINTTQTAINNKEAGIEEATRQRAQLEKDIAGFQKRLDAAPVNEQQYTSLLNDYTLAKQAYEDKSKKQEVSETAQNLEDRKAGQNLEVLDPASLPDQPTDPNRLVWACAGAIAGLVIGIVLAAAREVKDASLKNLKDVRAYTNMPILSSIPLLENALLVRRKRRIVWLAWSSVFVIGAILMTGSMYYHYTRL